MLFLYTDRLSVDVSEVYLVSDSSCLYLPHQEVFERQHASNQSLTWLLRGLGWLLIIIGFNLVAGILTTLGIS